MLQRGFKWLHRGSGGWVQQQALDPFVAAARRKGYICRSALKLLHIDDCYGLFSKRITRAVLDLGCSPGGWCQVIRERAGDHCVIFGIDMLPVKATVPNVVFVQGDVTTAAMQEKLLSHLDNYRLLRPSSAPPLDSKSEGCTSSCVELLPGSGRRLDVVTSDMCPNRMGGTQDRQRISALNYKALEFCLPLIKERGHFVCKVLGSRASYEDLYMTMCRVFLRVHTIKPPASRLHSDEAFLVGYGKLEEPRSGAAMGYSSMVSTTATRADIWRYGLDDWPGFARRPRGRALK